MTAIRTLQRLAMLGTAGSMALILVLTLTPVATERTRTTEPGSAVIAASDRCALGIPCDLGHAAAFVPLGVSLAALFVTSAFARHSPRRALAMLLLALWIFASLTEIGQGRVGREPSLADWTADMIGAMAGLLLGGLALRLLLARYLPSSVPAAPPRPAPRAARRPRPRPRRAR